MNDLRTAAQQALEALEGGADSWERVGPAIDALKEALVEDAMQKFTDVNQEIEAALAEPVQESAICDECGKSKHDGWALYCVKCVEPMFAPPQRKPLTDEEIKRLVSNDMVQFARAIERAHGIGGQP